MQHGVSGVKATIKERSNKNKVQRHIYTNAIIKPTTLYANFKAESLSQIPYLQGGGVWISHYQKGH